MSLQALVIGLGQIGMGYDLNEIDQNIITSLARAFSLHSKFDLIGGIDSDSHRRNMFEKYFGKSAYFNIDHLLKKYKPDVVAIATPTESHFSIFKELVSQYTPKVILCEKPLSYDINEAKKMVSIAIEKDILLFTNYMRRCNPSVIEFKNRITKNEFKNPIKGICWYSKGLFHSGSHFLNLFQYWLGDVIDFKIINQGRLWNSTDPEPDIEMVFEMGKILFLSTDTESNPYYSVELMAKNGRMRYEGNLMLLSLASSNEEKEISSDISRPQWHVVEQIYQCLNGNKSSICTGKEGLSTLDVLTQIKRQL